MHDSDACGVFWGSGSAGAVVRVHAAAATQHPLVCAGLCAGAGEASVRGGGGAVLEGCIKAEGLLSWKRSRTRNQGIKES